MQINLYKCASENKKVTKTLTDAIELEGQLLEDTSVTTPVITVRGTANLSNWNYAYIYAFGRYYYITDVIFIANGLTEIHLRVDVLMSYKGQFLPLTAVVARQEKEGKYNLYLPDQAFKTQSKRRIQTTAFPNSFSQSPHYVLVLSGGKTT